MNRRIFTRMVPWAGQMLAALMLLLALAALCGCSGGGKAEAVVEKDFADTGLVAALAAKYTEDTGIEVVITPASPAEIEVLIRESQWEKCIITDGDEEMSAFIEDNGLLGGEFCFDSLMLIAPLDDRAGVSQLHDVSGADVMKHIALTQSNFVHAPPESALGKIERKLWQQAGIEPEGDWYIPAGSDGLGILDEAQAQNAYALVDRRSVALVSSEYVSLKVVQANLKGMASSYYALTAPPKEGDDDTDTQAFTRWLSGGEAQAVISGYEVMGDEPAFLPGNAADYQPTLPTPAPEPTIPSTATPDTGTPETTQPDATGDDQPENTGQSGDDGQSESTDNPETTDQASPSASASAE